MATEQSSQQTGSAPVVQVPIPQSQGVLILGIFSLVTTFCCGGIVVGLVLGIIAVVMSTKALETYQQNPRAYTESSLKNVNGGRICGIIGIIFNGIMTMFAIVYLILVAAGVTAFFSAFPWEDYF